MKRLFCILLAMLCFVLPAMAEEENILEPFMITAPEDVEVEKNEGSLTFVSEMTHVVAIVIDRLPDEDPEEAVIRMMAQFDPDAVIGNEIPVTEGFVGISAVSVDKLDAGVNQKTIMILSRTGELLILSGYDMTGDESAVQTLLDALLSEIRMAGKKVVIMD